MSEPDDRKKTLEYLPVQKPPTSVTRLVISTFIGAVVGAAFAVFAAFVAVSILARLGVTVQSGIVYGGVLLCFALSVGFIAYRQIRIKQSPSVYNSTTASDYYLFGTVLGSGLVFLTLGGINLWIGLHR